MEQNWVLYKEVLIYKSLNKEHYEKYIKSLAKEPLENFPELYNCIRQLYIINKVLEELYVKLLNELSMDDVVLKCCARKFYDAKVAFSTNYGKSHFYNIIYMLIDRRVYDREDNGVALEVLYK